MAKFAHCYIERLLFHTEPMEAVHTLCDMWACREGVSEDREFFGFSEPEFHVHLYLLYQGEVGNGGHFQFFLNPSGRHTAAVSRALAFHHAADVFNRACSVFPSGAVPADDTAREAFIERLPESVIQHWARLDRELCSIDRAYWPQLLSYLRKHDAQILQPERA
ncbi:DUF4375 domain-containing protein [Haloferula sp. BvORR071]|uniref:DMP19 family protein n=1 Tax=Haloferula sp. BvORR071 TaxID=1396141 RepID=UPI00054DBFAF|nr:DUF4375 domain-containing protein [Haloferula sp. BvORR071]